ncbi:Leucine-rich repeat-containing protein 40 [Branchiostoma belcheri]|nr:Leucine-rich repeat-containing protein 40 [Branchiostoma belcheri]
MSKAFDRVDHALLLMCVNNLQVSPHMLLWIHNYLEHRQQRVVTHGKFSTWHTLTSGVPQGGVLSPYLFLLFMSTRSPVYICTLNVGYADDVSLSRSLHVAVANSDRTVEEEATQLDMWASDNKMILNGNKRREVTPDNPVHLYAHYVTSNCDHEGYQYLGELCCWELNFGPGYPLQYLYNPSCSVDQHPLTG